MGKIGLQGLEFFAYHGFHDEEQKMGNKYSVDITIETDFHVAAEKDILSQTINYEELYKVVRKEMGIPSRLLENIAKRIIEHVFRDYPEVNAVEISISKFNPPIGGVCERAKVTLTETNSLKKIGGKT